MTAQENARSVVEALERIAREGFTEESDTANTVLPRARGLEGLVEAASVMDAQIWNPSESADAEVYFQATQRLRQALQTLEEA